jgi:predicted glycosyltransferase
LESDPRVEANPGLELANAFGVKPSFPFVFYLRMRIWIDLANSPHVPFFAALIPEFTQAGNQIEVTARDYAQTVELAKQAGLTPVVIGGHGGGKLTGKAGNLVGRAAALGKWARGRGLDLAVSHNSYAQIAAASGLGIRTVTLMDYEHQPANHLAFRLASRVIVPRAFPESALRRFGAARGKVKRYQGTKEDVYLADFVPDPSFVKKLGELGVGPDDVLVLVRPPASEALYHRFENELFAEMLNRLGSRSKVKVILLARTNEQRTEYETSSTPNLILPREALDGANLIAAADLVISAGGTMNREAAALGVPAATIYAGEWAAVDEELVREGRLLRLTSRAELDSLALVKKQEATPRRALDVRQAVVALVLSK